jgi:hypothetical protein
MIGFDPSQLPRMIAVTIGMPFAILACRVFLLCCYWLVLRLVPRSWQARAVLLRAFWYRARDKLPSKPPGL